MKHLKFIIAILGLPLGIFIFIYGGYDDSPGAQLLGLIIFLFSLYILIKKQFRHLFKKK